MLNRFSYILQEFGDLPFENSSAYAPLSYLFFLSFVFFIAIVMMNLLTGLAVDDISIIRSKAEIVGLKTKIEIIWKAEKQLLQCRNDSSIGNFLNGSECNGFQLEYLSKVPEVKDTIHKHSLLYHMTYWVMETYPNSSDLYSEMGPLIRASRTDFEELQKTLKRMEHDCKNAWDYLKIINKYDGDQQPTKTPTTPDAEQPPTLIQHPNSTKTKLSEFLEDAAGRIILMMNIHKAVMQRYEKFLQWLGIPKYAYGDYKAHTTCKILSEFSLEYRTTRERVLQTIEKKKAAREKKRLARKQAELAACVVT